VLKRIMDGKFADPLQLRPTIGSRLAAIIRRLLAIDPAARYPNAEELAGDLGAFVAESGVSSPDATLAHYLADPAGTAPVLRAQTIAHQTELGEAAQARGELPVALDYFNRVLALDESNTRVLNAVQSISRRTARRRALARASSFAAAFAVLGGGVYALAVSVPARGPQPGISARPEPTAPRTTTNPISAKRPTAPIVPRVPPHKDPPKRHDSPRPNHQVAGSGSSVASSKNSGPRTVTFNPYPGNVSIGVDGAEPRAFGPSFREMELEPGLHRFKFVGAHDCCIDEEISVQVPPGEEPFPISRRLKFRPAGLYVVTEAPANVVVDDGAVSGRSRSVIQISDMSDLVETHHIRITSEGHEDRIQDVRLQAGQVVTVEVPLHKRHEDS
jgi:hypothetical protein